MISVIDFVAHQRAFERLTPNDRDALASCLRPRQLRRGEVVFKEGDVGDAMFFLADGAVRVFGRDAGRAQRPLADVRGGEHFGEMACIDPAARSATALALGETTALLLTRDALHALRAHCPAPAQAVFGLAARTLARRLGAIHARIVERVGAPLRASSGVIPKRVPPGAPRAVEGRVGGGFWRGAS